MMPAGEAETEAISSDHSRRGVPLCVDLDGTLIKTDLLWEAVLSLCKKNPGKLLAVPAWLIAGRANLKRCIAECSNLDPRLLPYRSEVLERLRAERARGRRIVLVSAAHHAVAEQVAEHLGIFDEVLASDGITNLKGRTKAKLLTERFGEKGFDYVGDHAADLHVWKAARNGFIVSKNRRLLHRAGSLDAVSILETAPRESWRAWMRAVRWHQWSKNILVLVPVLTSHRIAEPAVLLAAGLAYIAFSVVSSSVYLVNDLVDLETDRGHALKRTRAFAAGALSLSSGVAVAAVLLLLGLGLGLVVGQTFVAMLVGYYLASVAYSASLKRIAGLDVLILAGFYTLRIFSGGAATGIGVSVWLLAFSMFFFFSLALVKRYSELKSDSELGSVRVTGRGYAASDLPALGAFGISSGFISVLVLVLYVMSPEVGLLYHQPQLLLMICPLLLYWLTRLWILTTRGMVDEDPVLFALNDRLSYLLGILALVVVYIATS